MPCEALDALLLRGTLVRTKSFLLSAAEARRHCWSALALP
jgi:hypothetical protein